MVRADTEKAEVDVDAIVKDLQEKVHIGRSMAR